MIKKLCRFSKDTFDIVINEESAERPTPQKNKPPKRKKDVDLSEDTLPVQPVHKKLLNRHEKSSLKEKTTNVHVLSVSTATEASGPAETHTSAFDTIDNSVWYCTEPNNHMDVVRAMHTCGAYDDQGVDHSTEGLGDTFSVGSRIKGPSEGLNTVASQVSCNATLFDGCYALGSINYT